MDFFVHVLSCGCALMVQSQPAVGSFADCDNFSPTLLQASQCVLVGRLPLWKPERPPLSYKLLVGGLPTPSLNMFAKTPSCLKPSSRVEPLMFPLLHEDNSISYNPIAYVSPLLPILIFYHKTINQNNHNPPLSLPLHI